MNPAGAGKRKRGDRNFSYDGNNDGSNRPSPHRPSDMGLAQRNHYGHQNGPHQNGSHQNNHHQGGNHHQNYQQNQYGGGGRGGRRGGYNNRGGGRGSSYAGHQGANDANARNQHSREGEPRPDGVETAGAQQASDVQISGGVQAVTMTEQSAVATPIAIPATPVPAEIPNPPADITPYDYHIVTEEALTSWEESGRTSVLSAASKAYDERNILDVSIVMQELLRAGLDGKLDAIEAGATVESILTAASDEAEIDGASLFLDTLSVLTDADTTNGRAKFIVTATGISASTMREQLDEPLLQSLGLIRPTFGRMFIRKQTHALYRQSNYNLLREETEGYSKLVTELFTTSSDEPPSGEVVETMFENIKALIGAFDLDAGRVLDVTLDVFASLLVKHNRFFIKFLRVSSWWPQEQSHNGLHLDDEYFDLLPAWAQPGHSDWLNSEEDKEQAAAAKDKRDELFWQRAREVGMDAFFELGGRRILDDQAMLDAIDATTKVTDSGKGDAATKAKEFRAGQTRKWIQTTRTLPPPGNPVAAQLLGFKLRFYASQGRDADDVLPPNLIYLTALLIKIGFISLRDLYGHLYPEDESMEDIKTKQMKEKEERELAKRPGGGVLNALARASALPDDTVPLPNPKLKDIEGRAGAPSTKAETTSSKAGTPAPSEDEEKSEPLPEPVEQKVQLLKSLLCIGAIPEALYMIGRFPWLMEAFPDLPEYIHRIIHHSLSKVVENLIPIPNHHGLREPAKIVSLAPAGLPKGSLKLTEATPSKTLRWAKLDRNNVDGTTDYRFYWDDWSDNVPFCHTVDDVFTLCGTLLNLSGVKIGQDPALLVKLARIGKQSLSEDFSKANQDRWLDLTKRLLAPALSLTTANPGVVSEIYEIFKFFPTQTRYGIYAEWFTGQTSRLPDVATAFAQTTLETKDVLRRLTKSNMRSMARTLAKVSCASPGVVFTAVLNQIESYENLIDVVVECGRYFTYMGYDVLTWSIMSAMGKAGRSRISQDGINTSSWLNALALFAGKIFKRYSTMNVLPLLQYVLQQVVQGNFTDLLVLRELITNMTGIIADTDFTIPQVLAMSGGELLQNMTLRQVHDKRHESKVSAKRLIKCIVENDLAGSLLVAIAHQRQLCNFNPGQSSLKVIGENFDDIEKVLTQYLDMVRSNLSPMEFQSVMPDIPALLTDYGVEPSVAFAVHRSGISRAIEDYDVAHPAEKKERRKSQEDLQTNVDVEMQETQTNAATIANNVKDVTNDSPALVESNATESKEIEGNVEMTEAPAADVPTPTSTTIDLVAAPWHPVLESLISGIRPALPEDFETRLSLPFFVSFWQLSLHDMMAPLSSYDAEIKRQKDRLLAINSDRTDISTTGMKKKEAEKKAINDLLERLRLEMKAHVQTYSLVRSRLQLEKEHWFKDFHGRWPALNAAILQECFIPRLRISPMDSYFTQKMFFFLHTSGAPGFRTLHILDRLFVDKMLANLIFMCTAGEADNLGRFLMEILKELQLWHKDEAIYEKKAYGTKKDLPGFAKKLSRDGKPEVLLEYQEFRRILYKWHKNLLDALKTCMASTEYMRLKNAIMVSKCVTSYFPAVNWMGTQLNTALTKIAKAEDGVRPDLCVAANSQLGNLKGMEKKWMLPQAFYLNVPGAVKPSHSDSAAPSSDPTTSNQLDGTAAVFVPGTPEKLEQHRTTAVGTLEVEDGEVDDIHMTDVSVSTLPAISNATSDAVIPPAGTASTTSTIAKPDISANEPQRVATPSNAATKQNSSDPVVRPEESRTTPAGRGVPQTSDRPNISRSNSTSAARGGHTLPNRPENRADLRGPQRIQGRHQDFPAGRGRDGRFQDDGRLDRPSDLRRQVPHDMQNTSSMRSEIPTTSRTNAIPDTSRELSRQFDTRDQEHNVERSVQSHSQDSSSRPRDSGSAQIMNNSAPEVGTALPQSQPEARRHPRDIPVPSDSNDVNSTPINPKRRGLIEQVHAPPSTQNSVRPPEQQAARPDDRRQPHSRPHSRPHSKERHPAEPRDDGSRDGRSRAHARGSDDTMLRANADRGSEHAANGPRDNRNTRSGYSQIDVSQPFPGSQQSSDRQQNRMSQDISRQFRRQDMRQDINYGRLNADDQPTMPSQGLGMNEVPPRADVPTMASNLEARNGAGRSFNQVPSQNPFPPQDHRSGPQGYRRDDNHDRRDFNPHSSQIPLTTIVPSSDSSGIHSSRVQILDNDRLPPSRVDTGFPGRQTRMNNSSSSPASSMPPLGPRTNQQRPNQDSFPANSNGPSPTSRGPPTGPLFEHDRRRDSRRVQGAAETMQQAGPAPLAANPPPPFEPSSSQGASIRGIAMAQAGRAAQMQNGDQHNMAQPLPPPTSRRGTPAGNRSDGDNSRRNSAFIPPQPIMSQAQGDASFGGRPYGREGSTRSNEPRDRHGEHDLSRQRSSRESSRDHRRERDPTAKDGPSRTGSNGEREPRDRSHRYDDRRPRDGNDSGHRERDSARDFNSSGGGGGRRDEGPLPQNAQMPPQHVVLQQQQQAPTRREPLPPQEFVGPGAPGGGYSMRDQGRDGRDGRKRGYPGGGQWV